MEHRFKALEDTIRQDYGNTAGIVVLHQGQTAYEQYFGGFSAADPLHIYSVTKSVFSALIGIAIGQGHIRRVDQPVADFFPGIPVPGDVTLSHLLTMTAPYRVAEEPYEAFFESDDWVRFALALLGGSPSPGPFRYSPIVGSHILSGILASATGQPILAYAQAHLFGPLGMDVPRSVALPDRAAHEAFGSGKAVRGWAADPQGLNAASWGLCLTAGEMARFGQLYLEDGVWQGQRLLPDGWVKRSTAVQSRWDAMGLAYGYLWWVLDAEARVFAAMGDGGNVVYVNGSKGLVVAMACTFVPEARDRIGLIMEMVEPLF